MPSALPYDGSAKNAPKGEASSPYLTAALASDVHNANLSANPNPSSIGAAPSKTGVSHFRRRLSRLSLSCTPLRRTLCYPSTSTAPAKARAR